MEHEVAAGFLAEEVGVPVRTIQFWTDAGVLEAIPESDRQGRGRHRAYKAAPPLYGERACALIAAEMHRLRLPVGVMKGITFSLRWKGDGKLEPNFVTAVALRGEPMSILISPELNICLLGGDLPQDIRSGYLLNLTEILSPLRRNA